MKTGGESALLLSSQHVGRLFSAANSGLGQEPVVGDLHWDKGSAAMHECSKLCLFALQVIRPTCSVLACASTWRWC